MYFEFERIDNTLILHVTLDRDVKYYNDRLILGKQVYFQQTYSVSRSIWREYFEVKKFRESGNTDYTLDELSFIIGYVDSEYTCISSKVLKTEHAIFFSNDIDLKNRMFVAPHNISIMCKIDGLIDRDLYIGGSWEKYDGLPYEAFVKLLKSFPNSTELTKYASCRISYCLREYFPECNKYEEIYDKHIIKHGKTNADSSQKYNQLIKNALFDTALTDINNMLNSPVLEKDWQLKVREILLLLYPQYIAYAEKVHVPKKDGKYVMPDFLLVDANGFIDVMEIKKPSCKVISDTPTYRNNYVPAREFADTIQQIEKYRDALVNIENLKRKRFYNSLKKKSVGGFDFKEDELDIVSPQGILLLGRNNDLKGQQKRDFELIRRQYKNIIDIMTYDDLAHRLKNIVNASTSSDNP